MDKFQFMILSKPFTNLKNLKRSVAFSFFKFLIGYNYSLTVIKTNNIENQTVKQFNIII